MKAVEEIREKAELFGWDVHHETPYFGSYLHSGNNIQVQYAFDGAVTEAHRYEFFKVDDLRLVDQANGRNKKTTVISWLAEVS